MNSSKLSLADVLTLLTAFGFGFICFLGANFYTLGNINQSIILAVIIAVLLGGTALGAKIMKRTSRNFKSSFVWEIVFLVLFTMFSALFSYTVFPHYFVVTEQKNEIQNKLIASISQAEDMFKEYEDYAENRENLYRNKLKSVVYNKNVNPKKYNDFGFESNSVSDQKQIDNKMFTVHADLFPSNYLDMKKADSTWLANSREIVDTWKPIGIVNVLNDVEQNSKNWLAELIKLSAVREMGELDMHTKDFNYQLTFDSAKNHFNTLGESTSVSIGLAVLAYLLMMFSWIVTKRHSKFPGIKYLFTNRNKASNEL